MNNENKLSETWIKASILGTIWAASEIVLGSFLHNLKVPFSGNILTAIALIILISIGYIWKEKGLYWRAGLVCAVMKTMSPSAVIFGPMVAIMIEALILEISVRLLGRTFAGYILGAVFAMSWNLFQEIANFIIFYGYNIVDLYAKLLKLSQKQLNLKFDILWLPIIILLIVNILFGLLSVIIGIKIGQKLIAQPAMNKFENVSDRNNGKQNKIIQEFNYSLLWLFADIILVVSSLVLLNFSNWVIWSITIIGIVSVWAIKYKRAFRQLLKPRFWVFFILITMITALVFAKIQSNANGLEAGLLIGLQMNFRAAIIIVGFSVIGTELYNPKIRAFFLRTSFKQLPLALELSFDSLPSMIATIPDFRSIIKNPISVIYQIVSQAEDRLVRLRNKINFNQKVFILTGSLGQGKTTQLQKILEILKENDIPAGGIYSPKIMEDNVTIGYDIVNIMNNERKIFLRQSGDESFNKIGRFYIFTSGLQIGIEALKPSANVNNKIVIIDEIGQLELGNNGWASSIQDLIENANSHILLVVRDSFVEKVTQKWDFRQKYIYNISDMNYLTISSLILEHLKN